MTVDRDQARPKQADAIAIDATPRLRTQLMATTWLAEAIVIGACAVTAWRLSGGDLAISAPLLAVAALEATRVPLSSYATRLKLIARVASFAALAGIGVLTGEVMSLGFEMLIAARVGAVTEARSELEAARSSVVAGQDKIARLTAEANAARAELAALAGEKPEMIPVRSQTCASKHGSYDCTPREALRTNRAASASYNDRVRRAQEAAERAQERLDAVPEGKDVQDALRASEARYRAAVAASPMTRLAAEIFGVEAVNLSDASFERFKAVVAISLGAATAFTTALLAFLAHTEPRGAGKESKLARALRATLASIRKRLRRIEPTIVTQFRDRTVYVHVPVHPESGAVLDRNPRVVDPHGPRMAAE